MVPSFDQAFGRPSRTRGWAARRFPLPLSSVLGPLLRTYCPEPIDLGVNPINTLEREHD